MALPFNLKNISIYLMNKTLLTQFIIICLICLTIPFSAWLIGWHWQYSQIYSLLDLVLYAITETGSAPFYALIVSFILASILSCLCKKTHWIIIFLSIFILQGSTQVVKTIIKQLYQEPRPYMSYLIQEGIKPQEFYSEKRPIRKQLMTPILEKDTHTPSWLKEHWKNETGYSFPSGHTAFAVCWVFIFIGFLYREQKPSTKPWVIIITLWALFMMISRMRLGMHYPIDLFVSIIFVFFINLLYFYVINTKNYERILMDQIKSLY